MSYSPQNSELYELLRTGRTYKLGKDQVIDPLGDRSMVHYLEIGYIRRYLITHEGNKSVQNIYGPSDIFPLTPVYTQVFEMDIYRGPEQYYYESMTEVTLHSLEITKLRELLNEKPELYKDLFYAAGVRLNSYIHRMEDRSLRASLLRTAHMVAYLGQQFGKEIGENQLEIQLPLTKQSLAEILDLTRETVSRDLNRLKARGFIETSKRIVIKDMSGLTKLFR
jgi:CRP-like cAMP-binding protein